MNRKNVLLLIVVLMIGIFLSAQMATAGTPLVIFDDMEHGDPLANGWFAFEGSVGGGGIGANATDLPPEDGGAFSLQTGWGSGGNPGFFGGFGRTNLSDLSSADHFNLWINPDTGQDYTLEINLQDDDNGDDAISSPEDDEFQFNCVVSPTGPCAVSGDGWQQISIPLADFFDDNSFFTGGNGVLDAVPTSGGGNGQLVTVVIAIIGNTGSDVNFRTDYWSFSAGPLNVPTQIVDDFESGLPSGVDGDGTPIGFNTFSDGSPVSIAITDTPPAPVPGSAAGNNVVALTGNVGAYAGFTHSFENAAVDTWVPQDWSSFEGLSFWLYGLDSGTGLFVDILDNRNPGSTKDDAERFVFHLTDDFAGWQYFEIPFSSFVRKEIGNGAPNDGLTLTQVHGWALGMANTGGNEFTFYMDDVSLYGVAEIPELAVNFAATEYDIDEGTTGDIIVKLNRPMNSDDPAQVSVDYFTEVGSATPDRDYTEPAPGTLTFVNGGPSELGFSLETLVDSKWEGTERVILRLTNPVDVAAGFSMQAAAAIIDNDPYDPYLLDDFERGVYLWHSENVDLSTPEIAADDPLAVPNQDAYEHILQVDTDVLVDIVISGSVCNSGKGVIPVAILTTDSFDALSIDHNTVRLGDAKETHRDKKTDEAKRHEEDFDGDGDMDLVFHFRASETGYDCDSTELTLTGETFDGQPIISGGEAGFGRDFPIGQDWAPGEALSFWFYGTNSGDAITLQVKDNRAPDPGPSGWNLVWSEEFNEPAGTPPSPEYWTYEIGDGVVNGIPGWGNDEFQYYTDDPANAATDDQGNMVLTVHNADGSLQCYYGPCEYTSARLISQRKAEFAYGRIESRIQVPEGEDGLWPAFWSLGTDIDVVDWPQTGEIDFMEYVSRLPNEIFGTIHGPGYAGGQSFGNVYDFAEPVYNNYHTFAIEWQPDLIKWYVDDMLYHTATPADVAPNEWVFNDPVFLLLNVAIGGNFGGAIDPELELPQSMKVDYIRVYQGPDTAERWETTFADNFEGWQRVEIPFASLTRSAEQPAGAPDDGLNLNEVWGYGFELPEGGTSSGVLRLDQVRLELIPLTVTNLNDSGAGSLRQALADIAIGGTITFDPALAGGTITLTTGPLEPSNSVTIDAADAPGLTLSGGGGDRVLIVDAGLAVNLAHLTVADGYGYQLAGGILNNGVLTLDHVTVTDNTMTTDASDFWQGGGGIYNGEGATLHLIDSSVVDNNAGWSGGGIFSFFNTTTIIERSTIAGNLSADVGGGLRLLGNAEIVNSTISGNEATGWYGGALFLTDGVLNMTNATVVDNVSPSWAPAALFVGTFGAGSATLNLANSIVANNVTEGCFLAPYGAGPVAINSLGSNVFSDGTCFPVGSDQIVGDPGLDSLADNGGPTLTHALLAGSPAIDAADTTVCPAVDQRGFIRDAACDVGAFELVP